MEQESAEEALTSTSAEDLAAQKREERLRKFRELHLKRNEARKLNHQELVEEDRRQKLPSNWEARKARAEWALMEEEKKKECAAKGIDYERAKMLEITAKDAERRYRKLKRKTPDPGFSDYASATQRQYQWLTKKIKVDLGVCGTRSEEGGEDIYPTSSNMWYGTHVPSKACIDNMVTDLQKQIQTREKYSRRRPYNDDIFVDHINQRNAKFNKKLERYFGKYSGDLQEDLERGSSV